MSDKSKPTPPMINGWLRFLCGTLALALALGSIVVVCNPPIRVHADKDAAGSVIKQSESPAEMATPFTVVFVAASGLLLYVINGYRITKLAAGGVEAEAVPSAGEKAVEYFTTESPDAAIATNEVDNDSPEPTEAPSKVLTSHGDSFSVFELTDIPFTVIADAIGNWPDSTPQPKNLAEFEFATRKQGKGNHPWIIKFNGCQPVKVSYGGRAKTESTVDTQ